MPSHSTSHDILVGSPPSLLPSISRTIAGRKYSCSKPGHEAVLYDESNGRTPYVADVSPYLPLLTPKLTKAGKAAKRQPEVPRRSVSWWRAQCGFRGLAVGGSAAALQDRIREHGNKGLGGSMRQGLEELRKEYEQKNRQEVEKVWREGDFTKKVKLWPRRVLFDSFKAQPGSGKKVLSFEVDDWGNEISEVCRQMGVCCEMRKMPYHKTGQRMVIVGSEEKAVRAKFAETSRDAERVLQRQRQEGEEEEAAAKAEFRKRLGLARAEGKDLKGKWNVSGQWEISCPYIESESDTGEHCSLELGFTKPGLNGQVQFYATFEFIILTGIMRFVNPRIGPGSRMKRKPNHGEDDNPGDDQSDDDDTGDDQSDHDENSGDDLSDNEENSGDDLSDDDEGATTPNQYLFPKSALPSFTSQNFVYRWRGEETGEGEIELGSDTKLCSLTFESPNALRGTFSSAYTGKIKFNGFKAGFDSQQHQGKSYLLDPGSQWSSRSGAAHEHARIARWR